MALNALFFPLDAPPLSASGVLFVLAVLAGRSTLREWRRCNAGGDASWRGPSAMRIGLLLAGPIVICAAELFSFRFLVPPIGAVLWLPFKTAFGFGDADYYGHVGRIVEPAELLLAGTIAEASLAVGIGWLAGRAGSVGPIDGFWLANPATIIAGQFLCLSQGHAVAFDLWGPGMWALRGIVMCPLYAWVFYAAGGGLTRGIWTPPSS